MRTLDQRLRRITIVKRIVSCVIVVQLGYAFLNAVNGQTYTGPIPKPSSGYGQDGTYTVEKVTFPSPLYRGKSVEVFYPKEVSGPRPVVFYCHPFGGERSTYNIGLYHFIAKKGYVVVFAPYATFGMSIGNRYATLWESFKAAAVRYPYLIDTQKVGFMGHSFGGGAAFALAYKGFVEEGWGAGGRFIFVQAQWYSFEISQQQLNEFPSNVKLIAQVYADDVTNDHRMAIDMFNHINIENEEKDFILVRQSKVPGYIYTAQHNLPNTRSAFDAYDYYAVYRLVDALIDYSFNGNQAAKQIALGNASKEQITMPSLNGQSLAPLEVTDNPVAEYPQSKYQFKCKSSTNKRNSCPE